MTKKEMMSLKWGDNLKMSAKGKENFNERIYEGRAIFLRAQAHTGTLAIIVKGRCTFSHWSREYWDKS